MNTNHIFNHDHHIWNNNGTWWCHFTVHNPDHTKERVRVSLHTKDRDEARRRRDFIIRGTAAIVSTIPSACAVPVSALPRQTRQVMQPSSAGANVRKIPDLPALLA